MKVTFPHMGYMYIAVKGLLEGIGLDVIVPPYSSKKTLNLGIRYSPEYACLPFKINIGNFIEAYELGADTIVMGGGIGPCRFGYYAQVQQEILRDLGLNYNMIVLEPPDNHYSELFKKLNELSSSWWKIISSMSLAYAKAGALDRIETETQKVRARETNRGCADKIFGNAINLLEKTSHKREISLVVNQALESLGKVSLCREMPLAKIAIVGEIYTVLEPFVNLEIEKMLGDLGVEVNRSVYLSQWINDHLFLGLLPGKSSKKLLKIASPHLNSFVGGHGRETVAATVAYARQGYDGVIQLAPFTCMPEIVAHSVLPVVSKEYDLPMMSIYLDEHSGETGLRTRIEAFVDLITKKRKMRGIKNEMLSGHRCGVSQY